jgi:hypothetical protein
MAMRGKLTFKNPGAVPAGQSIRIVVQDTSRANADAVDVAEKRITVPEDFDAETDALPFEIDLDDDREGLTVRAHMPRHDGDDVRVGDMVTTSSIAVRKDDDVEVTLHRV